MEQAGFFISFEGPEGAGKSTILKLVAQYLKEQFPNEEIVTTREPGGTKLAEQVRAILQTQEDENIDARAEALLFAAARRQHVTEVIKPSLAANKIVLSDRYVDSSLAYQGAARGLGIDEVYKINKFAIENCLPDLTIIFDLDVELGLKRIYANRQNQIDRLDKESLDFHKTVRQTFLQLVERYPDRNYYVLDASKDIDEVLQEVKTVLTNALKNLK